MMALAGYGGPSAIARDLAAMVDFCPGGQVAISPELGNFDPDREMFLGGAMWTRSGAATHSWSVRAKFAWAAQELFEEMLLHVASHLHRISGKHGPLVFSGGCALNTQATRRLAATTRFESIFVPPAPHDGGTAVGAAMAGLQVRASDCGAAVRTRRAPAWGPSPGRPDYGRHRGWREYPLTEQHALHFYCRLLRCGAVCALVDGPMEFGPRALGHRSILGRADSLQTASRINRIKQRATYRPLAPAILEAEWAQFFTTRPDPFMNRTVMVRPELRCVFAGASHIDGSARAQAVVDPRTTLAQVLHVYRRSCGYAMLINTSLNRKARPIARTADDGLAVAADIGLDAALVSGALWLPTDWAARVVSLTHTEGADARVRRVPLTDNVEETSTDARDAAWLVALACLAFPRDPRAIRTRTAAACILLATGIELRVALLALAPSSGGDWDLMRAMVSTLSSGTRLARAAATTGTGDRSCLAVPRPDAATREVVNAAVALGAQVARKSSNGAPLLSRLDSELLNRSIDSLGRRHLGRTTSARTASGRDTLAAIP